MSKLGRAVAGGVLALGLCTGSARAGEPVFTDEGWYRVEGADATPTPDSSEVTVSTEPARPPGGPAGAPPMARTSIGELGPASPAQPAPTCMEERGKLVRRMLALHGLEVGTATVRDAELGGLGAVGYGAPLPFSASLSLDPDLNALSGNAPVPPSSINWDSEARWAWLDLLNCESGG